MEEQIIIPPNNEYLELNFVGETATGKGNNTTFIMEAMPDGTFKVTDGRVGITIGRHKPKQYHLPMEQWNNTYTSKIKRGYLLTKQKKMEQKTITQAGMSVNGNNYAPIADVSVKEIVERLLNYANTVLDTNYTIKVNDISDEMIAYGTKILQELAKDYEKMSVAEFNGKLKTLYAAIPRRMDNLSKCLAQRKIQFNDIIANEQDLFDIMLSQIRSANSITLNNQTILEAKNLIWETVTEKEEEKLKKMLGSEAKGYLRAWKVQNKSTEKAFQNFCVQEGLTEDNGIHHLFHGSRNENFWSIVTNGLTVNPSGVVITGKMFGNGTYFAPKAAKSMGYTSRSGSRWANGSQNSGFLAVYKVATGKCYDRTSSESDLNWERLQQRCPGAHCTWAHAGSSLLNDEVIVYQNQQSTIEYLIEIGF